RAVKDYESLASTAQKYPLRFIAPVAILHGMSDLLPKLTEMRSGTSLLACRFPLPECDQFKSVAQIGEGIDAVYVYKRM
ncbi:hypothetical protein ANCDUO_17252, partial [Ancylostoma duodenale]